MPTSNKNDGKRPGKRPGKGDGSASAPIQAPQALQELSPHIYTSTGGLFGGTVDWEMVSKLASLHCTPSEIAAVMGLGRASLIQRREFQEAYAAGWEASKMSLRRMQWLRARDGNVQMLVFLGKNILGQRDCWSGELTGRDGGPIQVSDESRPSLAKLSLEKLQMLREIVLEATPQLREADVIDAETDAG